MYDKNSSSFENTTVAIKKLTEKETINSNKSILISGTNKKFIELELVRGGVYTFSTSTLSDTTIKLYDSNGNLLRESYDPNADYSEDNPDLNANMTFYSRGRSRIVFLEVSIDYIENFYLDISYYTD